MVILSYLDADSAALSVGQKMQDVAAGTSEDATFSWDTADVSPGSYKLQAVAILGGAEDAVPENDSFVTADPITVGPPTYGVDVTAIEFPDGPVIQGNTVEITVAVENLGSVTASIKMILNYIDARYIDDPHEHVMEVANQTENVAAGASKSVTFPWDTTGIPLGSYTFHAVAVLEDDHSVSDYLFSATDLTIAAAAPDPVIDVGVTVIELPAGPVYLNDTAYIKVTIANLGEDSASVTVSLGYIPAEGDAVSIAQEAIEVAAEATEVVSFSWDTTGVSPGSYTFQADAIQDGDTNTDNNSKTTTAAMTIAQPAYDVAVTAIAVPDGPVIQGNTVEITATIENLGSAIASVTVTLNYLVADSAALTVAEKMTDVAAGASEDVTFSWDTADVSPDGYTFQAVATLEGEEKDLLGDNSLSSTDAITVAPPTYDVSVTGIEVPDGPVIQGNTVEITVTVANLSSVKAMFEVGLVFFQSEDQGGLADEETVEIEAGADTEITLFWDTSEAAPGDYSLRAGAMLVGVEDVDLLRFLASTTTITVLSPQIILGKAGLGFPDASFGGMLAPAAVETSSSPVRRVFIIGHEAKRRYASKLPGIITALAPHTNLFTANAQAAFGSGIGLQNPFELGEIRVKVHLQERQSSLGAYVTVGSRIFFAEADGNCNVMVPMGVYDLTIRAPGYVSARVPGVRLGVGEAMTVPELTLPFGDSNGDGRIDILDLSIAAGNFGATVKELSPP